MKEIRLHGRGGQGTVTASEIIVYAAVAEGMYANAVPYFGFERSGAPVSAFVRMDEDMIWPKTQVYHPDCLIVMDASLRTAVPLFDGTNEDAILVINASCGEMDDICVPDRISTVGRLDASRISREELGRDVPNTVMLGAFARTTGWLPVEPVADRAAQIFGEANHRAVRRGFEEVAINDG